MDLTKEEQKRVRSWLHHHSQEFHLVPLTQLGVDRLANNGLKATTDGCGNYYAVDTDVARYLAQAPLLSSRIVKEWETLWQAKREGQARAFLRRFNEFWSAPLWVDTLRISYACPEEQTWDFTSRRAQLHQKLRKSSQGVHQPVWFPRRHARQNWRTST